MKMKIRSELILWAYWAKSNPYKYENAINFRWSNVQEEDEEEIALANFIESLQ